MTTTTTLIQLTGFASIEVTIYVGTIIFIIGIIGEILNILVFLSLQTFRQSSCAFYLTIMSIVNIGYLCFGLGTRLLTTIYNIDLTITSLFYCKFQVFFAATCVTISMTCFCLATIDQYCATCSRPRFQQWCNIKLARYVIIIIIIIWILHGIPYLFLFYHSISPITGNIICTMSNTVYIQYRTYFYVPILYGSLPVFISMFFGLMAYFNIQKLAYYTVPLVRRELDKQLTTMVLTQVVVDFFVITPFIIIYVVMLNPNLTQDALIKAQMQLAYNVTFITSYLYFGSPFYIYMCTSERFRRQLIYVLFEIHLNRCRGIRRKVNNQVIPQT